MAGEQEAIEAIIADCGRRTARVWPRTAELDALRGLATPQREAPRASRSSGSGGPNADDVAAALMKNEAFVNALTKAFAKAFAKALVKVFLPLCS